ncbi:MAG: hypothetical protein ABI114_04545 [Rhodanobacter sp.]
MSPSSQHVPAVLTTSDPNPVTQAILDFVSHVPASKIDSSTDPAAAARQLANRAAQRAALTAGSLALPPGPLGWLTLLPEMIAIWKIQGQMVSDIAAAYDKHATLGREQMMWCLFRHTAAQAFRDLVVRMGDRLVFRRMSHRIVQRVAKQIGVKMTQRTLGKGLSRWLPVVGALGVGAYAYYDTAQVATTAIALFSGEAVMEDEDVEDDTMLTTPATPKTAATTRRASKKSVDQATTANADKTTGSKRKTTPRKPRAPDEK